jgi:enoyl-CoA hydratase/carnithine racemase
MNAVLSTDRAGAVLVATLSSPPVNALNDALVGSLDAVLDRVAADDGIAVLHIRSGEKAFCAGADLAFMRSCFSAAGGGDAMLRMVARLQRLLARIESLPAVTLAEIGGAALGGGLELALACDLRIAAADAKLGLPETGLGLLPGAGGTQRLTRLAGHGVAARLILGAEVIDGAEAERLGIVQWARPRAELADRAREIAARVAALPRAALAAAKRCMAAQGDPARDGYAEELAATRQLYDRPETRRRISEFLDRPADRHRTKETT